HADKVELFANGIKIREQHLGPVRANGNEKVPSNSQSITWKIPRPAHDVYLVAVASGPGITVSYWAISPPFQPGSPSRDPRVIGATNPLWVDADGDGKFTAPRTYAAGRVRKFGDNPSVLLAAWARYCAASST